MRSVIVCTLIMTREEMEKRMDELAREYVVTRDPQIIDEPYNLRLELMRLEAQKPKPFASS